MNPWKTEKTEAKQNDQKTKNRTTKYICHWKTIKSHGRQWVKQQRRRRLRKLHLKSEVALIKIYRAFSISFNPSNVGYFFWSEILKDCIKVQEKKKALSCVHVLHKTRPHESLSAGTAYLIFASTRIRCDVSGSDSTIHTDTLLRFTFANYWPVQLPVSMLKWNPRLLFRGICKCFCGYIEHTRAQFAGLPIRCLYYAPVRALDEPKVVFELEDPEEESF